MGFKAFFSIDRIRSRVKWKRRKEASKAIGNLSEKKINCILKELQQNKKIKKFRKALDVEDNDDKFDFLVTCLDGKEVVFDVKTRPIKRRRYKNVLVPKLSLHPETNIRQRLMKLLHDFPRVS